MSAGAEHGGGALSEKAGRVAFSGLLLLVGVALFASLPSEGATPAGPSGALDPYLYPRLLLLAWIALAAVALLQASLFSPATSTQRDWITALGLITLCGLFIWLILTIGFLLAAWAFFLAAAWLLGYRRLPVLLGVGLVAPAGIWWLFHHVIQIRLPTSAWTHLL